MGAITLVPITAGYQESATGPQFWVIATAGLAIGLGTYSGDWRIMRTTRTGIVDVKAPQGFAAEPLPRPRSSPSPAPPGEIVLFDRSRYNRAVVERVMGFCGDEEYTEFMQQSRSDQQIAVDGRTMFSSRRVETFS